MLCGCVSEGPLLNQEVSVHLGSDVDDNDKIEEEHDVIATGKLKVIAVALCFDFHDLTLFLLDDSTSLFGSSLFHDHVFGL